MGQVFPKIETLDVLAERQPGIIHQGVAQVGFETRADEPQISTLHTVPLGIHPRVIRIAEHDQVFEPADPQQRSVAEKADLTGKVGALVQKRPLPVALQLGSVNNGFSLEIHLPGFNWRL